MVTNQSGVARRYFIEETLEEIHKYMKKTPEAKGARILDIFHCPQVPNSGCHCRRPAAGQLH